MLLPGMMRLRRFWFGRFFGWLLLGLKPIGVKDPGLIDALVSVRAKEIALRLQQIRWKTSRTITVEIGQRRAESGNRDAEIDRGRNDDAPFRLRSFDDLVK